jgi:hypothetical protein
VNCSCSYLNQQQKTVHIDKKKNISKGGKWCGVGERTLRSPERVDSFFLNSILRHWAIKTTCRTERETKSSLEFFAPICTSRI